MSSVSTVINVSYVFPINYWHLKAYKQVIIS